ncbi:hypothetical protein OsI_34917 [Oryza sativa Indica Group]|uniref:FLZ-type domain-containing protein n=2 Tax=Oryza sativa TaxID=4530 RepID=B9G952_ORYSJ|nr:hypothetical protein OsI_34917 [Oryza sativa Indica Group]EEE51558.1 hypothetical protein OsJ_32772 [Oryza sativa Japonica Group]
MGDSLSCQRNTDDDAAPPPPLVPVGGQQQPEYMSSEQVRTRRGQPSSRNRGVGVADEYQTRRGVDDNVGVPISSQPPTLRPQNFMRFCATCNRTLSPQMNVYIFRYLT